MGVRNIPDDIVLAAVAAFRTGNKKEDVAAAFALSLFLNRVESGKLSPAKARKELADAAGITKKVATVDKHISAQLEAQLALFCSSRP